MSTTSIDFDPSPVPMRVDEVYASIDAMLARTAPAPLRPWHEPVPVPAALLPAPAGSNASAALHPARRITVRTRRLAAGLAAALAAPLLLWWARPPDAPPLPPPALPAAAAVIAVAPPSAGAALPRVDILTGSDASGGESRLAHDLLGGGVDARAVPADGWAQVLARLGPDAPLALLGYDALQAARRAQPDAPLRIVAPLYRADLHVLARADSPLRFVHQIEGRRVNIGRPGEARALTARTLHRGLFARALPARLADERDVDAGLAALLDGEVDAMLVVAPSPSDWLAALPAATAGRLKLLALDAQAPASRRALRQYLPSQLRHALPGTPQALPALSVLTFVVAAPGTDEAQARFAQALCRRLPALQRDGPAYWRDVLPSLHVDAGWPSVDPSPWRDCAAP